MTQSDSYEKSHIAGLGDEPLRDELALLLTYWRGKSAEQGLPSRQDIDPLDIPTLLPFIFLVDVLRDADRDLRYRYRLIGTRLVDRYGYDLTGRYLDTLKDRLSYDEIVADYTACVTTRQPVTGAYRYVDSAGRKWHYQRLVLPLSEGDGPVNMLMGANCFALRPDQEGPLAGRPVP